MGLERAAAPLPVLERRLVEDRSFLRFAVEAGLEVVRRCGVASPLYRECDGGDGCCAEGQSCPARQLARRAPLQVGASRLWMDK